MNRWISNIIWWWQRRHSPLSSLPDWRKAKEAERHALSRGCTQAIHKARRQKYDAVHSALRGLSKGA